MMATRGEEQAPLLRGGGAAAPINSTAGEEGGAGDVKVGDATAWQTGLNMLNELEGAGLLGLPWVWRAGLPRDGYRSAALSCDDGGTGTSS